MADNKSGREDQAQNADRRQRERAIAEELERRDEPEPPVDPSQLAYFETELDAVEFPASADDVVATLGDREIEASDGTYAVEELLPATDVETFDSPAEVRERIERPTVAATMKHIVEASETLPRETLDSSQWDAYQKTLRELAAIDADDDDEGVRVIGDWIVDQIDEKGKLPGSRAVRREAAKFCRSEGYEIRNDEWLGV
ncbi:hypothetical protein SAMN05216388_101528 [Halorientalis persicus]|uniref:Uncharacterized protein n=1 Tax=Halorientalis persicus TaxID=1367881 RepID=A0A1H8R0M1_9EURY|nr:hypothetical protein [Halorientalis persicus]SEO59443.1 hypothetical protein SAMN05216388_101528 [Halorientalis persicus]